MKSKDIFPPELRDSAEKILRYKTQGESVPVMVLKNYLARAMEALKEAEANCLSPISVDMADDEMVIYDNLDDALIGFAERCGQPTLAVYDHALLVECFVKDGMTDEEAMEYIAYNITGGWLGERTPIVLIRQ